MFQESPAAFDRVKAREAHMVPMGSQESRKVLEGEEGIHKLKGIYGWAAGKNH